MRRLWVASKIASAWNWLPKEPSSRKLELSCPASNLGKGEAGNWANHQYHWFNQSFLGNGTYTKSPKQEFRELLNDEHSEELEGSEPRESMEASHTLPYAFLTFVCVCILYNKPINKTCFLSFVNQPRELSNLRRGLGEPPEFVEKPEFVAKHR